MLSTSRLVVVCAGKDTVKAAEHNLPLLQLCVGVGAGFSLKRLCLPARTNNNLLGLSDIGITDGNCSICVNAVLHEVRQRKFQGIFADFEQNNNAVCSLLSALDKAANNAKIPFFVPICHSRSVENAILVTQSALSGGNFEDYILELNQKYPNRIAVSIRPICTDFILPSPDSEGTAISEQEMLDKMKKYGAQSFFSRDLCAKYFTYMDENEQGHFVLFDDSSTISAKIERLHSLPVKRIFALYPHVSELLTN